MTDFLTADTSLPSYMMFPRFLLDMEINETSQNSFILSCSIRQGFPRKMRAGQIQMVMCSFTLQLKHWQKFSTKAR